MSTAKLIIITWSMKCRAFADTRRLVVWYIRESTSLTGTLCHCLQLQILYYSTMLACGSRSISTTTLYCWSVSFAVYDGCEDDCGVRRPKSEAHADSATLGTCRPGWSCLRSCMSTSSAITGYLLRGCWEILQSSSTRRSTISVPV